VAALDLNGDGKPDLAVANDGSEDVSVLLNNGNGTFAAAVPSAGGGAGVAAADLNGDGMPELIVTGYAGVSVLRNSGNGTFAKAVNYGGGVNLGPVAVGDLNGMVPCE